MKIAPLFALCLAGCSLYFGPDDPSLGPPDPGGGGGGGGGGGDPLPARCGTPELHVISAYEAHGNHGGGSHPPGDAQVVIERPGDHALVLSAYEPVNWHVSLAPGVNIESVTLIGYHMQTVDLPNVPVTRGQGCGYSYPYNGGGCDTDQLLALAKQLTGAELTTFHGCYQASRWALHADGTVASNCNTAAGYEVDELIAKCDGGGGGSGDWEKSDFHTYSPAACTGDRYVRYDEHYGLFVGAILCGDARHYKLYLSDAVATPFLEISDFAGHGQDHCELVNPAFTIPNEDDITSGGCTECSVGQVVDINGIPTYARANFGQSFERVTAREWADLTNPVYACGVAIP
jgi:hypothetical protein